MTNMNVTNVFMFISLHVILKLVSLNFSHHRVGIGYNTVFRDIDMQYTTIQSKSRTYKPI